MNKGRAHLSHYLMALQMEVMRISPAQRTRLAYLKIIKEKDQNIKQLRRCWDNFINSVPNTNDKITDIANEGYTPVTTELHNEINSTLCEIQKGTDYIAQLTFEATYQLHQVDKYPYDTDTDTSEPDQFSGYFPSPPPSPMQDTDSSYDDSYLYDKYGLCAMDYLHM